MFFGSSDSLQLMGLFVYGGSIAPQNWANDILAIAYNAARNNSCRQVFLEKMWVDHTDRIRMLFVSRVRTTFVFGWGKNRYVRLSLHTNKDGKIPVKQ